MRKVRSIINLTLGSMIAAFGLSACNNGELVVEYGVPIVKYGSPYVDTTMHCMYGVDPTIPDEPEEN